MKLFSKALLVLTVTAASYLLIGVCGEQCGKQAGGALCPNALCCSSAGWCGSTDPYCGAGCQSQCTHVSPPPPPPVTPPPGPVTPPPPHSGVGSIITQAVFEEMLKYRNDERCKGHGFYTYNAFIAAAGSFGGFGTTGDDAIQRRELAAFFGQTSHETTGGWDTAPDGPYAWGYCFVEEQADQSDHCVASNDWPCAPNQKYFGRGPIQISYNYNYGPAGKAIGSDLLNHPDLVSTDPLISFKTALWFWMTPQGNKPSSHDVITGSWVPSAADTKARRVPGYGVITNIINGGIECGNGPNAQAKNRVGFYKRYCGMLGVDVGSNLDCNNQRPFSESSMAGEPIN